MLERLDRLGLANAAVARGVKTTTVEVSRSRRYPVSMPTPASRADPLRPCPSLTDERCRTPAADVEARIMPNHLRKGCCFDQ
jgi:hypothetical protein